MYDAPMFDVASVLGIEVGNRNDVSPVAIAGMIENGFPLRALDRVTQAVAPADQTIKHRIVPRATLARRRKDDAERLTSEESGRTYRLAQVWAACLDVWKEPEAARAFLYRSHPLLDQRRPIDVVLGSDLGARLVEDILGRLKFGSAA